MLTINRPLRTVDDTARSAKLEQGLARVFFAALFLLALLLATTTLWSGHLSPGGVLTGLVPAAGFTLVGIDLARHGEQTRQLIAIAALPPIIAAGDALFPAEVNGLGAFSIGVFACGAWRTLSYPWNVITCLTGTVLWAFEHGIHDPQSWWGGLDQAILSVGLGLALAMSANALQAAGRQAQQAAEATRAEREALQRDQAERDAVARASSVMHDEVIHALRMVASTRYASADIRAACRTAVDSVAALTAQSSPTIPAPRRTAVSPRQWALANSSGWLSAYHVEPHLTFTGNVDALRLTPALSETLNRVIGEALRNIARHAGAADADLRISTRASRLRVAIIDTGRGLPSDWTPGFGIRHSILGPVGDLGGTANFTPTPGGGTTLTLDIPLTTPTSAPHTTTLEKSYTAALDPTGGGLPFEYMAVPATCSAFWFVLRFATAWHHPWVAFSLGVAYVALIGAILHRLPRRPPTWPWLTGVIGLNLLLAGIGLWQMPPGALLISTSFTVTLASIAVGLCLLTLPTRLALGLLALFPLMILVSWQADPTVCNDTFPFTALLGSVLVPLGCVAAGHGLRHISDELRADENTLADLTWQRTEYRAAALIATQHLDYTRRTVSRWLDDIATGRTPHNTSEARTTAAQLIAEVRDDLYVPGFLDDARHHIAAQFRARGGTLHLRPGLTHAHICQSQAVLDRLLTTLGPAHTITVTPPQAGVQQQPLRVVIVPPAPTDAFEPAGGLAVVHDPSSTVISIRKQP